MTRFKTTQEIINHLNRFVGKTTNEINPIRAAEYAAIPPASRKGAMGWLMEEALGVPRNSSSEPDFGPLGELKVIPMLQRNSAMEFMNPEYRMVLSMLNYSELLETPLVDTHIFGKMKKTIITLYLHDKTDFLNNRILTTFLWVPNLEQMELDYNIMQKKSRIGRIREGDCTFLANCPKHGGGWKKLNPALSSTGSRSDHPIHPIAEKRAYCIKREAIGQIISESTGILHSRRKDWFRVDAFSETRTEASIE